MNLTYLVFFEFFDGASDSGAPPVVVTVRQAPFLVNIGTMLNR